MNTEVKERVTAAQDAARDYLDSVKDMSAATTYTYDCQVSVGAVGGAFLNVDFKTDGNTFAQFKAGLVGGIGGYTGWGKAWFNTPVENLIGQSGAVFLELVGVLGGTAHVQITGPGFIGNCSTGGIGIGGGIATGGGKFSAA